MAKQFSSKPGFGKAKTPAFSSSPTSQGLSLRGGGLVAKLDDLKDFLLERKIESLVIVCALGLLIAAMALFMDRSQTADELARSLVELQEKQGPIDDYQKALKSNQDFLETVPKVVSDRNFSVILSEIASRNGVAVSSFSTVTIEQQGFYRSLKVTLECQAASFKQAVLFLSEIEKDPFAMKVSSWVVTRARGDQLEMTLDVSAVQLVDVRAGK